MLPFLNTRHPFATLFCRSFSTKPNSADSNFINGIFQANAEYVKEATKSDRKYFHRLAKYHKPDFLMVSCCDSRVPLDVVTESQPGELFTVRNVANQVNNNDLGFMCALQYAVEFYKVTNIVVVGHTKCGGVKAALTQTSLGLIDQYLQNIKNVWYKNRDIIDSIENPEKRLDKLVELNVIHQVQNLYKMSYVQKAWKDGRTLRLHGWVFDIGTGKIKDLKITEDNWRIIKPYYKLVDHQLSYKYGTTRNKNFNLTYIILLLTAGITHHCSIKYTIFDIQKKNQFCFCEKMIHSVTININHAFYLISTILFAHFFFFNSCLQIKFYIYYFGVRKFDYLFLFGSQAGCVILFKQFIGCFFMCCKG